LPYGKSKAGSFHGFLYRSMSNVQNIEKNIMRVRVILDLEQTLIIME